MAISRRLRYEVLRRDSYTCRYCGAKAPEVKITADHVVPVALGGTDEPSNLVAACDDCNGGKTSTTPDAPVVADVSEDALRWARAMAEAANQMRAEFAERQDVYSQFEEWWGGWTYGFKKEPIPKPDDWRNSVDGFLAAGLPLDVLQWCVNKAMTSKATPESTWRYMCGIAWRKVNELQESARQLAGIAVSDQIPGGQPTDSHLAGMVALANKLLATLCEEDRAEALEWVDDRDWCKAHNEPVLTEEELVIAAAEQAFESSHITVYRLTSLITNALKQIPGDIGLSAMRDARTALFDSRGPGFSRDIFVGLALSYLEDEIAYPEASAYLESLPSEASAEWIALALEENADMTLSDKGIVVRAAARARHGKRLPRDRHLCRGTGQHTPVCLERPAYFARIAGLECCEECGHDDHPVCGHHLEQLMAGTFTDPAGKTWAATDFTEIPADRDLWAAPF